MKKLLSILMLLMTIVIGAKAETEVSPEGGTSNATVNGTSFTIDGTYNAGSGTKLSNMTNKGVKIRTNRNGNTLTIAVNEGYQIDAVDIYLASNDNSKTIILNSISVDGSAYTPSVTLPLTVAQKNASAASVISVTDIAATENIVLSFGGTHNQGIMQLNVTYTQTTVITQEITAATLYGTAIGETDLATLKSTKALTIDGSSLNGIGVLGVTLNTGATTPTVTIDGNNAVYTFSINGGADVYTVTVTNVKKSYSAAQGSVVYYDADALSNEDKTLTMDGIVFNYSSKTFGYANNTAGVTLGSTTYKPIKLSTGEAVTVTFPTGKKATKIIVYGWSAGGNGKLVNFGDGGSNTIDTSNDIFYGEDLAINTYPSVYEYDVDNWEALTFQGNGGQPFVVLDFVLADAAPVTPAAAPIFKNHENKYIVDGDKICLDGTKTGAKVRIYAAPATYVRVNVAKGEIPAAPTLTSGAQIDNISGGTDKESGNLLTTDDNTATYYVRAIAWDAEKNPESANEVVFTILPGEYNIILGPNGYSTYAGEANITVTDATVYTATVGGSSKVTLTECAANAVIGAGKGIVLKGTQGDAVTIKTTAATATVTSTGLEGVTSSTESINANPYVLSSNGTKTAFVKAGAYGTVEHLMNKAYLDGNANSISGNSIDVDFEGEATAINNVNANENAKSAAPVKVIKNGKLYIGNYNVAGAQVK